MIQRPECDTHFEVIFDRNPVYERIYYCPFCGAELTLEDITTKDEPDAF
jgi:hypothetical protein